MFSLILTLISIALVAALALATLYYGGGAFSKGAAEAKAAKILQQGQQLLGAAELYKADTGQWPLTMAALVTSKYLKALPVAKGAVGEALAADEEWKMPSAGTPVFVLKDVDVAACRSLNKKAYGVDAVLKTARTEYRIQCFGQAITALKVVVGKASGDLLYAAADPTAGALLGTVVSRPAPPDRASPEWLDLAGGGVAEPEAPLPAPSIAFLVEGVPVSALAFPDTEDGSTSAAQAVVVRNSGARPLRLPQGVAVSSPFTLMSDTCVDALLAPAESCVVSIAFMPSSASSFSGAAYRLSVPSTGFDLAHLTLEGMGVEVPSPAVEFSENGAVITTLKFPDTSVGSNASAQTVILRNSGTADLVLGAKGATVDAPFIVSSNTCSSKTLAPDATCSVAVSFSPTTAMNFFGAAYALTLDSNLFANATLPLEGNGTMLGVMQAFLGEASTFVQRSDGVWAATGQNHRGQLGVGDTTARNTFTVVPSLAGAVKLVVAGANAFAQYSDGSWAAAGNNDYGQLNLGTAQNRLTFTKIPALAGATQLSAGEGFIYAKLSNGAWAAAGRNYEGQLGLGDSASGIVSTLTVVPSINGATQVVASAEGVFAQLSGGAWVAAGSNSMGRMGMGSAYHLKSFKEVPGLSTAVEVVAGTYHAFAKLSNGNWVGAGYNASGQVGAGGEQQLTFIAVPALNGASVVIPGATHTFAKLLSGVWAGAGNNQSGQQGTGDTLTRSGFNAIPALAGATKLVVGGNHTFAKLADGTWAATGSNGAGQLGDGTQVPRSSYLTVVP